MKEEVLRGVTLDALERNQPGLLIWASWDEWEELDSEMKPGNELYDFAISRIMRNKEATVFQNIDGFEFIGCIAVSTEKLYTSKTFFNQVINYCKTNKFEGPITYLPSNELSNCY